MVGTHFYRRMTTAIAASVVLCCTAAVNAVQIQDIVRIKGSESSKLVGMGLVVGLNGTGDGGKFLPSMERLAAMMNRLGNPTTTAVELKDAKNVAIVTVTAKLPASGVREGDTVDVVVASVGPAKSLAGGRLFMTPLLPPVPNPNAPVFAFAEGGIQIEETETPTVGVVPGGAAITRDVFAQFMDAQGRMTLVLDGSNATWPMANTLATMINDLMAPDGAPIAIAKDQKNIVIDIPLRERSNPAAFISQILEVHLDPTLIRSEARVVINERTETIVITGNVEISPVVISHKGLTITTINPPRVPTAEVPAVEQTGFVAIDPAQKGGAKLADLLAAFNQLKVPAADRIAIIKEIHRSGKLHGQLILED